MHSISNLVATAAVVALASAGDAPVAQSDSGLGVTYSATLPNSGVDAVTGAVIGSVSPDGRGTNFQVSFYNLPGDGSLSYGLYTSRVSNGDCNTAGAILDPYAGTTGTQCKNSPASCQVGDLSDKHGDAKIISGGAGTGYFSANYMDPYVSIDPGNKAFFGKGSVVVKDSTGVAVACANFINQQQLSANSTKNGNNNDNASSSTAPSATPNFNNGGSTGSQQGSSSSTSEGGAVRTAAPLVGAGILGMAALLI